MRYAEGRLEADGTLACSYHGWRFGPDGKCTAIPQVWRSCTPQLLIDLCAVPHCCCRG